MGLSGIHQAFSKSKETLKSDTLLESKKQTKEEIIEEIGGNVNSSIGVITSDVLMNAPADFFREYDPIVEKVLAAVRNDFSETGESDIIAQLQRDPTNKEIKDKARTVVRLALTRFNDGAKGGLIHKGKSSSEVKVINAMVMDELLGLGPLEPLWNDTAITEIIVNGPDVVQVEIAGVITSVDSCHFRSQQQLLDLISRLYTSINKTLSRNDPLVKGRLHDKSRMMAVHPIVAPTGPNFNIRRHSSDYTTPQDLIDYGSASEELMTYLGNLINAGVSYLVVGGTGSGKTTLLDALTSYIPNDKRCVTLEDNLEMKTHPKKKFAAPMETVDPKPGSLNDRGITMRDLVKASTQMRPDTIIIGEVTDQAAYDLCQALNTGHDGGSTIHANSPEDAMFRIMSLVSQSDLIKGEAAYDLISSAFDVIIFVKRYKGGSRKISQVVEIARRAETDDEGNRYLPVIPLWTFVPDDEIAKETGKVDGVWVEENKLSDHTRSKRDLDMNNELTWAQLQELARLD